MCPSDPVLLDEENSRGGGRESGEVRLEDRGVEAEGVLAQEGVVDELHDDELVQQHANDDCEDEPRQLRHDDTQVGHTQDLAADHRAHAYRRQPAKREQGLWLRVLKGTAPPTSFARPARSPAKVRAVGAASTPTT